MSYANNISQEQLDTLKEVGNIGAGNAATALSNMLNRKISMAVPNVRVETFNDMIENLGGFERVVVAIYQRIEGDIEGSIYFILPIEQAEKYVRAVTKDQDFSISNPPYSDLSISFLHELGNILSGNYLSSLADLTKLQISPSVPSLSIDMIGAAITVGLIEISQESDLAIVIETVLDDESADQNPDVKGEFFFLPVPDSFDAIFTSLGI